MIELSNEERETHLSLVADDRSTWHVYSDDKVMQRKFESVGAKLIRVAADGVGRFYELRSDQILIRTRKRKVSDAQRVQSSIRMHELRAKQATVGAETVRIDSSDGDKEIES